MTAVGAETSLWRSRALLRDELHEPLGLMTSPAAPPRRGGGVVLAAIAALVVAGVAAGQAMLIRNAARAGRPAASTALARPPAPPETPPLRLSAVPDPPPAPPAPALAPIVADAGFAPPKAKPARVRAGAPEPLIIDVKQALAALRAQDAPSAR
jgi:hypothetical protein